ncbi:helicase-related protein [Paenibacillus sp. KACC 21273]|uniref:DEAD/DEAH box helicase n=1 Tax=Paenibacillus sp. KACC 21273 TaxID=3025665 RepID=UPI00236616FD|nr:helicase-related protein [Paenibacillus sp. KACC 21273]WDF51465.1 helicase-related protein [Paenibacillus sp. KACC 21273]
MQIALYAIKQKDEWSFEISLDLRIDLIWWTSDKRHTETIQQMIYISSTIPLGWALQCKQYLKFDSSADHWDQYQWKQHIEQWLFNHIQNYNQHDNQRRNIHSFIVADQIKILWDDTVNTIKDIPFLVSTIQHMQDQPDEYIDHSGLPVWKRKVMLSAIELTHMMQGRSLLETEYMMMITDQQINLLTHWKTYTQLAYLTQSLRLHSAVYKDSASSYHCRRCGSQRMNATPCASCGSSACAYCETCLNLGRSRECTLMIQSVYIAPLHLNSVSSIDTDYKEENIQMRWRLSDAQTEATTSALYFLKNKKQDSNKMIFSNNNFFYLFFLSKLKNKKGIPSPSYFTHKRFLLWAVTGAGKTEMTFPLIDHVLQNKGKVLVATPRRDVVLELAPRMAKAFPATTISVLYGGSEDRWRSADLTIATTHQLLRFSQAFDLVILDELDAFPFHNDPMLAYAANACCKYDGAFVYLSATPPVQLQKEIKQGILAHAKVPARFHGHPLPVPKYIHIPTVTHMLNRKQLSHTLLKYLRYSVTRQAQVFIFVSRIALIESLVLLLRSYFPQLSIEGTSSQDHERADKVLLFREQQIRILVTTTILERGVTIPYSDVYILDADSGLFDASSLVQMAGRAGRSKEDPKGNVIFGAKQWTIEQKKAVSQIKLMNRIARRKGYLHASKSSILGKGL